MSGSYEINSRALKVFGNELQMIVCAEKLSELIQAVSKALRGTPNPDNIAEEMADVEIVLEQLGMIFCNADQVHEWKKKKLSRLARRVAEVEKGRCEK